MDFVLTSLTEHFRAHLSSTILKSTAKGAAEDQTKRPSACLYLISSTLKSRFPPSLAEDFWPPWLQGVTLIGNKQECPHSRGVRSIAAAHTVEPTVALNQSPELSLTYRKTDTEPTR